MMTEARTLAPADADQAAEDQRQEMVHRLYLVAGLLEGCRNTADALSEAGHPTDGMRRVLMLSRSILNDVASALDGCELGPIGSTADAR